MLPWQLPLVEEEALHFTVSRPVVRTRAVLRGWLVAWWLTSTRVPGERLLAVAGNPVDPGGVRVVRRGVGDGRVVRRGAGNARFVRRGVGALVVAR
jgi:hypothetical protein